jgi:hypothetical protein
MAAQHEVELSHLGKASGLDGQVVEDDGPSSPSSPMRRRSGEQISSNGQRHASASLRKQNGTSRGGDGVMRFGWDDPLADNDEEDENGSEYEMLLDPNLPEEYNPRLVAAESEGENGNLNGKHPDDEEDSPYPEVRAAVHNYDEDMPCNTIRAWTIGLSLVVVGASMNTLFSLRQPSIGLGALIAQIIAWPLGHGWAKIMPNTQHTTLGIRWNLNPGPFNIKEHSIIVVMASVSFSVAYATDIILAQVVFYKQDFGTAFQLLLTISTQSLGYGIAGIMRKFLGRSQLCHLVGHGIF